MLYLVYPLIWWSVLKLILPLGCYEQFINMYKYAAISVLTEGEFFKSFTVDQTAHPFLLELGLLFKAALLSSVIYYFLHVHNLSVS